MKKTKLTKETKEKISRAMKGRKLSDERKKEIGQMMKRLWADKKFRHKTAKAMKGKVGIYVRTPETRAKQSKAMMGKSHPCSEETKKKMKKAAKKNWVRIKQLQKEDLLRKAKKKQRAKKRKKKSK